MDDRPYKYGTRIYPKFSGKEFFKNGFPVCVGQLGQKTDLSEIDAQKRDSKTGQLAGNADERAVAAKDDRSLRGTRRRKECFLPAVGGQRRAGNAARFEPLPDFSGCNFEEYA